MKKNHGYISTSPKRPVKRSWKRSSLAPKIFVGLEAEENGSWRCTLPETNSLHLKMDRWNTSFLLGWPIFQDYVSFRECGTRIGATLGF